MKKLKIEKDYWFPSPKYINNRGRKRSIAKIFDIEYEDDNTLPFSNGHIHWSSTTAQPKKTFIIPIGDIPKTVKTREVRWIKGIIGLFKKSKKKKYFGKHSYFAAYDRKRSISRIFKFDIYPQKFIIPIGGVSKSDAEKALKELISLYK